MSLGRGSKSMKIQWREQLKPGAALREIVQQATAALVRMDAERLEELARCCIDLHCQLVRRTDLNSTGSGNALTEIAGAVQDLEVLKRVLGATRDNLKVFTRLRLIQFQRLREMGSYGKVTGGWGYTERGGEYGDN
jgi:hypothetical protein